MAPGTLARLPGFTADAALATRARTARPMGPKRRGDRAVAAQLGRSPFTGFRGGFSTLGDYWTCADACYRTYSACLDGCEGTWESPKGSSNCTICDDNYRACKSGCTRDIA